MALPGSHMLGKVFLRALVSALSILWLLPSAARAQSGATAASAIPARIVSAVDEKNLTILYGNTHPFAIAQFDQGAAPTGLPMNRMLLVLRRSFDQEATLEKFMEQQQDSSSSNFHQWLTPQQFGQQFGPADADIKTVTAWLESHGFQVSNVTNGKMAIEFSGTAGQVKDAFHTEMHKYTVNGQDHWANSSDPQIPAALAPVVAGVDSLYNFPRRAMHELVGVYSRSKSTGQISRVGPQVTFPNGCNVASAAAICQLALGPADFAKIYNVPNLMLSPAPTAPFSGDHQTIAVVGESEIKPSDVAAFRTLFGLPAPNLNIIVNGPDPGVVAGAETEADLDVEWSGAVAPNATIDFVIAQATEASLGVDLAALYVIDNNLAPVLSESFGICELALGTAGNQFYNQLWQQAAAQGITVVISSGDSGSAVCDPDSSPTFPAPAQFGLAVSGFASTPYNVAVGGTDFNYIVDNVFNAAPYWNTTNGANFESALGYIPEVTWNNTCTNLEIFGFFGATTAEAACNSASLLSQFPDLVSVTGGSGGQSACTISNGTVASCSGGYAKPSWQAPPATPNDQKRDVPDVSLFASNGFNGSFYVICEADITPGTSCDLNSDSDFIGVGGTSASAPAFAAIMALVNQATGARQGNANYVLYQLAATGPTCVSSASPASNCVFYDIASNDITGPANPSTNAMPCAKASPNCTVTNANDTFGVLTSNGQQGYNTASGYDLATGLGSVNAANLIHNWMARAALAASSTTLTLNGSTNPLSIAHGQSVSVAISVTGSGSTPTGSVALVAGTNSVQGFPLSGGAASGTTKALPGGSYSASARYGGDGTFAPSASGTISVTVSPEASTTSLALITFNPLTGAIVSPNATSASFGAAYLLRMNVASTSTACNQNTPGESGCPTGSLTLTDNNNPLDGGTFPLNTLGYAEDQTIQLGVGTHPLKAVYSGDVSYTGSQGTDTITITQAATATALAAPSSATTGSMVTLTALITTQSTATGTPPSGTVQFMSASTSLGSVAVVGGVTQSTGFVQATANLTTSVLPVGTDTVTATYSGDANYSGSTSLAAQIKVANTATTVVTISPTGAIQQGQSVTATAKVNPTPSSGPTPTGTIQFSVDSIAQGSPVALANGQAQFTAGVLAPGGHAITAAYSGDANYGPSSGSASPVVTLLITAVANPSTISIQAPGQSGSTTITLTAFNGFSGSATLSPSLCSGLPSESSCSLNPSTVTLATNGAATTLLTITTTAKSVANRKIEGPSGSVDPRRVYPMAALAGAGLLLAFARRVKLAHRGWAFVLVFSLAAVVAASAGCGGGGSSTTGGGSGGNAGTPLGTTSLSVTITATGGGNSVPVAVTGLFVTVQ